MSLFLVLLVVLLLAVAVAVGAFSHKWLAARTQAITGIDPNAAAGAVNAMVKPSANAAQAPPAPKV